MTDLVTPDPEQLGIRVTGYTPLGKIVARLRQVYPDAPYADVKALAERMRRATEPPPPEPEPEPEAKPKRRRLKTEADESMVPVEGGSPMPAEPPTKW